MPRVSALRAAVVALAGVALAALAFVTCDGDHDSAPAAREARPAVEARESAPRERRASRATPPDAPAVSETAPSSEQPRDDPLAPPEDDGFPSIDVEVVCADGTPAERAHVYALKAGAPGRDDFDGGLHTTADAHGRCRLPAVRAGTFDVGAVSGPLHAIVRDVPIPAGASVRIELPPGDEVVVVATADARAGVVSDGRRKPINLGPAAPEGMTPRAFPGRGELLLWAEPVRFADDATESRVVVPRSAPVRVVAADAFVATPEAVQAPATLRVDVVHRYGVVLTADVVPAAEQPAPSGWLVLEVDPGPGGSPRGNHVLLDLAAERARGMTRLRAVGRFAVGGPGGTIRWRGPGVVEGSASFGGFAPDVDNLLDITVRLDGTALPAALPVNVHVRAGTATRVRVADPSGSEEPVMYFVAGAHDNGMGTEMKPGDVGQWGVIDPAWVAAWRRDQVAGPVRVGEPDSVNELTLGPAARLAFAFDATPPEALGPVTIERADGVPLIDCGLVARADVREFHPIGPFPPGEHEFVLRIGGEEVRRVRVTVTAGEDRAVRLGRLSSD